MDLFDLHCDTITECLNSSQSIKENNLAIDKQKGKQIKKWVQTFAIFINDDMDVEKGYNYYIRANEYYNSQDIKPFEQKEEEGLRGIKMVEGLRIIGNDLSRIEKLKQDGVKTITLTWNGENQIASGAKAEGGLKEFGKEVVKKIEKEGMFIDLSHLNEKSFYDVMEVSTKRKLATHSNSYRIHPHCRNLKDNQIKLIKENKGIIGLNFYNEFIGGDETCIIDNLLKHADKIMNIGGEDILAIGSDFDGAEMTKELKDLRDLQKLYDRFEKYYGKLLTNKIFYKNAINFYSIIR